LVRGIQWCSTGIRYLTIVLLDIYINDIQYGIKRSLSIFADDTKTMQTVDTIEGTASIDSDLERIEEWSIKNGMKFNVDKCCVMHCGRKNPERNYELYGTKLRKTTSEKDLGVIINCDMKFKDQVAAAAKKANRTLGMIKRNFECMKKDMFEVLYSTLVRPHLEHAVAVWSPYQVGQKEKLERVQRRATKMVKELRSLEYNERLNNERLNKLNLMSTEDRRKT